MRNRSVLAAFLARDYWMMLARREDPTNCPSVSNTPDPERVDVTAFRHISAGAQDLLTLLPLRARSSASWDSRALWAESKALSVPLSNGVGAGLPAIWRAAAANQPSVARQTHRIYPIAAGSRQTSASWTPTPSGQNQSGTSVPARRPLAGQPASSHPRRYNFRSLLRRYFKLLRRFAVRTSCTVSATFLKGPPS